MKRFYETKEYSFQGLVSVYKRFSIPTFQRSYKWKNRQITDFFSAIELNDKGYFIGNIVCVVGEKNDENRLVIVDGQQRLTTITLLLIALRDYASTVLSIKSQDEADSVIDWLNEYLKDRDKKERKDYFILKARKKTYNDVLIDLINQKTSENKYDKAQGAYLKAYRDLKNLIADKVGNDFLKLEDFAKKVLELEVVAIVLNSDKEVFNAFDGLNSKGLGLSTSDQIKNYLFSRAEKLDCLDDIEERWDEMESDFEKTNPELITKFLRYLWIAENKYVSGKDLYKSLQDDINKKKSAKSLIAYSENLLTQSKFYLGLRFNSFSHYLNDVDIAVREVLYKFRFLDNQQVHEILLALYLKSKNDKNFKPKYFRDIAQLLWNFCLRTKYLIISPSAYERKFADYCKLIKETKSEDIVNKSKSFFEYLRKITNNRDEFLENLIDSLGYDSDPLLLEFLLRKLIENKEKNLITLTKTSIEHILPQEPKEWGLSKKDIKDFVHNIGNLTLLHPEDNQKAQNKKMDSKCSQIYDLSHFKFNKLISSQYKEIFIDDYKEAIKQRGQDIAEQIYLMTKI